MLLRKANNYTVCGFLLLMRITHHLDGLLGLSEAFGVVPLMQYDR